MAIPTAHITGPGVFLADLVGDTIRLHIIISGAIKIVTQAMVRYRECESTGDEYLLIFVEADTETYASIRLPVDQMADCVDGVYFLEIV